MLIGNFGAGNYGDEAILAAFLKKMVSSFPAAGFSIITADEQITKAFLKPFFTQEDMQKFEFLAPIPFGFRSGIRILKDRQWKRVLEAFKSVSSGIYCGGGLFTDEESRLSVPMWASYGFLLNYFKKPILGFGLGIGPLNTEISKKIMRNLLSKMDFIGVRDSNSEKTAGSVLTGDTAFLLDANLNFQKPTHRTPYISVSLRPFKNFDKNLYKKIAQSFDAAIAKFGFSIVLIPFQKAPQNDEQILNKIIEHSAKKEHIFSAQWSTDLINVLSILKYAEFNIGMRLHSNIFSVLVSTPFLMIPYMSKGTVLLNDLGLSDWFFSQEELTDAEKLNSKLSSFYASRQVNKNILENILLKIQDKSQSGFLEMAKYIK